MPQEIAATLSRSTLAFTMLRARIQEIQSASATQAPVIDAVRVPPSAWITSQSMVICRSPSACRSMTERNERMSDPAGPAAELEDGCPRADGVVNDGGFAEGRHQRVEVDGTPVRRDHPGSGSVRSRCRGHASQGMTPADP